jgi:molecular chaperone DnaK (HSP70)
MGDDFEDLTSLACVYLVGGSCELPVLARALRDRFGKRVRRSPYPSAATAIGLAIVSDQDTGYQLQDRFHRHFGVWRESEAGTRVVFDPIFSKGTLLPPSRKSITVTRRYQPAHNIGHFRFVECSHLDGSQEPRGDIVAWDQVFFPFDPQLAETELNEVAVQSWKGPQGVIIEEQYRCDSRGMIEVRISNLATGLSRRFAIRQGKSARAAKG